MKIGVSGKIASGKTEVMKLLQQRGFTTFYTDEILHELYRAGNKGQQKIEEYFGNEFLNSAGDVDREKLRELVFNDEQKLEMLNHLMRPIVFDVLRNLLPEDNYAVESIYFPPSFDGKIVWVERPYDRIMKTLTGMRGFSEDLARKAGGLIQKPKNARYVLENNDGAGDLLQKIDYMLESLAK